MICQVMKGGYYRANAARIAASIAKAGGVRAAADIILGTK
jgi:UDP:flavonoid glycosyltransferase YjiC (YdhE family)